MFMESGRRIGFGSSPASTLYDVARVAGVSTATVSRVVNGQDRVRPSTRRRVLEAIEALGYVPDGAAQSLAQRRKEVIGLVAIESRGPETDVERDGLVFIEEVLRGVERLVGDIGWSLLISLLRGVDAADAFQRMQKISAKVDGMLIVEGIVGPEQLALLAARVPIALIAAHLDEPHAGDISGQLAVRQLLAGPPPEPPDAIVCGNDQMAIGAMRELQTAGIRVPADIAVVGFDDIHLSSLLAPPLTTVRQPMRLLGERACSRLLQRIGDPALPPQVERLPTELIVRESCGCVPPDVSRPLIDQTAEASGQVVGV